MITAEAVRGDAACVAAEVALLGRILRDGNGIIASIRGRLRPLHLYRPGHRVILRRALALDAAGKSPDLPTMYEALRDCGELERAGGHVTLSRIETEAGPAASVAQYVDEIREAARQRLLARLADDLYRLTTRDPEQETADSAEPRRRALTARIKKLQRAAERGEAKARIEITLDVRAVVDQAIEAIIGANSGIFQRGGCLVRVVHEAGRPSEGIKRAEGAPIITRIGDAALFEILTDAADWNTTRKAKAGTEQKPAHPPKWARDVLLARGEWPGIPWLGGVIDAPTMRPDGSILAAPGYDAPTGVLLDPRGVTFPPVKDRPTRADAESAMLDLGEPFFEFPFADQSVGVAACVAAVLTLIGRPAFDGPAPMYANRSTTPGSGKDLAACAIVIIGTGREPARTTAPRGKEADGEWRKRILAHAIAGDRAILIGNVEGSLGSPTLSDTLTKTSVTERVLGENRKLTLPIFAVWFATGNGLVFKGDLGRRVIPIDLDPEVEHPEDREGPEPGRKWAHPDLLGYVRERRPHLVSCALTILRAFHVAGRPSHGKPAKGSFDNWDRLIRGAVIFAGGADPLDACETIREEGDADLDALRGALACWWEAFGNRPLTASEAVAEARERAAREIGADLELLTALATLAGCDVAKLDGKVLGYALRRFKGRPAGGLRFKPQGANLRRKVVRWTVAGEPSP